MIIEKHNFALGDYLMQDVVYTSEKVPCKLVGFKTLDAATDYIIDQNWTPPEPEPDITGKTSLFTALTEMRKAKNVTELRTKCSELKITVKPNLNLRDTQKEIIKYFV